MSPIRTIGVLGGGAWGTALANAAASTGRPVVLWMRDAEGAAAAELSRVNARRLPGVRLGDSVRVTARVEALGPADALLLAIPAQEIRPVLSGIGRDLPQGAPIVICAKGIERGTGRMVGEVVRDILPAARIAVLSGPSFAADVARGLPTAVALAAEDAGLAEDLAAALSGRSLRVYHGTDLRGVQIGGATKNVLAIAVGIVDGRGLGESAKAALTARGFAELLRFAAAAGGRPETLMGLSGLGDLVLTCGSAQSRNFALGLRIGAGMPVDDARREGLAEGAYTADALVALAREAGIEMPIAEAVAAVIAGAKGVDEVVEALMARPLRRE
ncbi:MAG: glycerol-3-phosphate dehydrogenase [Enterovirga sp.]|nr:glycerol-3-phosphate dehydrogenase [Enterovirga sp.]